MDLRNPINKLGLQTPTRSDGGGHGREKSKVTLDMGGAVFSDTRTQPPLWTQENLNRIHDYSTTAHRHTHRGATDDVKISHLAPPFFFQAVQQPTFQAEKKTCHSTANNMDH